MITVTLYTKEGCALCEEARRDLAALQESIPHNLALVDIDKDPDLRGNFAHRIPVLQVGPYTLEAPFDRRKIEMTLAAARDRQRQLAGDPRYELRRAREVSPSNADRFSQWLTKSYMFLLNFVLFLYVGLPFLAPVLMEAGYPQFARPIYTVYGAVCHQLAFRSWFLFGEQPVYPRAAAGVEGYLTFQQATGIQEEGVQSLIAARNFVGNEQVGYKVAFCQRDIAIYGSMLVFGLIFAAAGQRLKPLHWSLWILVGVAPIALDGFSQLFSQIPGLAFIAFRESTPLLRTITGFLFGFTTAWFGFPLLEESMSDARVAVATKRVRIISKAEKSN